MAIFKEKIIASGVAGLVGSGAWLGAAYYLTGQVPSKISLAIAFASVAAYGYAKSDQIVQEFKEIFEPD